MGVRHAVFWVLAGCGSSFGSTEDAVEALTAHDLATLDRVMSAAVANAQALDGAIDVGAADDLGCDWTVHLEGEGGTGAFHAEPVSVPCGGRVDDDALDVEQTAVGLAGTFAETSASGLRFEGTGDRVADVTARLVDGDVMLDGAYTIGVLRAVGERGILTQLEVVVDYPDLAGAPGTLDATGTLSGGWSGGLELGRGTACLVAGSFERPVVACTGALE